MSLSWYYVYSQRYEALHHMLKDSIKDPRFNVVPLFVEQSEFNKTTYNNDNDHFLSGCFIKQEILLLILKKLPKDTYFIFSDADCVVTKETGLYEYFQSYMNRGVDMAYMWEGSSSNIGISILRANDKTIAFYESVLKKAKENPKLLDQDIVCSLFPEFTGVLGQFDKSVFCLSNYYKETEPKSDILMVQFLCGNSKDYRLNMMQKYMGAKIIGIPIETYIKMAINNGRTSNEIGAWVNV